MSNNRKFLTLALIGKTNVGKSTIFNQMVGKHLSAVTHKRNTTINLIYGLTTKSNKQIVLIDTPGLEKNIGNKLYQKKINEVTNMVDVAAFVSTAKNYTQADQLIFELLVASSAPLVSIITKIDRLNSKDALLDIISKRFQNNLTIPTIPYNCHVKNATDDIVTSLNPFYQEVSEFPYPTPRELNQSPLLIENMLREQLLLFLHEEIPYNLRPKIESIDTTQEEITINLRIIAQRKSIIPIVVGKNASKIKLIGIKLRKRLTTIFKKKTSVFIKVSC